MVNWEDGNVGVNSHKNLSIYMYKLVGFRYLPQFLKQYCWFYPDDIAANEKIVQSDEANSYNWLNINFFNQINKIVKDESVDNCFKLIHIEGTHEDFTVNRFLEEEEQTSITEEGRGVMLLVDEYLKKLKMEGIYDNAIIMIMADHGHYGKKQSPLLLVKGLGEKHEFQINERAVSYSELCEAYKLLLNGTSSSNLFEQNVKSRKYYFYKYKFKLEYEHFATDIIEYESQGEAHDAEALYETGVVYKGRND